MLSRVQAHTVDRFNQPLGIRSGARVALHNLGTNRHLRDRLED